MTMRIDKNPVANSLGKSCFFRELVLKYALVLLEPVTFWSQLTYLNRNVYEVVDDAVVFEISHSGFLASLDER